MERLQFLEYLIKNRNFKNYLEIGVEEGHIFFKVKCPNKIAVDPKFIINPRWKIRHWLYYPLNIFNRFFEKTSDKFFDQNAPKVYSRKKIHLALVDGMHEYEFALRDIENTVEYMEADSVILVHDCNPIIKQASVSFKDWEARQFTGHWNGDVWKAILHIRSLRKDLTAFVLDCDHGIGFITKKKDDNTLSFTEEEIQKLTFENFELNRDIWLDLKPEKYFFEYFKIST